MGYRAVALLTLLLWSACGEEPPVTPLDVTSVDVEDTSALEDIPLSDVESFPEDGVGDVASDASPQVVDIEVAESVDVALTETWGATDTEVADTPEVGPADASQSPDVGPDQEVFEVPPACEDDADCDDSDPCTEDSCFANGVCFHDLVEACCNSAADCDQPASTCVVAICVAHGCVLDDSDCVGDEVVTVQTVAGAGGQGHLDGAAADALFFDPFGFDVDAQGKLFVVEILGATVRLVADGEVLTVAGGALTPNGPSNPSAIPAGFWGYQDGPALDALFNLPMHVAVDASTGDLYVADGGNHMVRKVSDGQVSTVAGDGILSALSGDACDTNADCPGGVYCSGVGVCEPALGGLLDGPVGEALFSFPIAVLVGDNDALYVTDVSDRVRVIADGEVSTLTGGSGSGYLDGPLETAKFDDITDMAWGPDGALYLADNLNHRIRRIQDGVVSTVAGTGLDGCPVDTNPTAGCHADGPVEEASLAGPTSVTVAADGTVYVAEQSGHRILRISDGMVTTLAGTGEPGFADGPGESAQFNLPTFLELGPDGSLFVSDRMNQRIRRVLME